MSTPLVSIIMPVFNCSAYISDAVNSIIGQKYKNWELFICDDASSDNSYEILESYISDKRIILLSNPENVGKVETVNQLIPKISGELLTIHDSDDISMPERLIKQVEFLRQNSDFAMVGCSFSEISISGKHMRDIPMPTNYETIKDEIFIKSQFHGPTMLFRTSIIEEIGGVYRFFRNKEDIDLSHRIVEKFKASNIDEILYHYRIRPDSLSKKGYDFLKFEGMKLINMLSKQRKKTGTDSLIRNNKEELNNMLKELEKPYIKDPSLFFRNSIAHNLYYRFYKNAYAQVFKLLGNHPSNLQNWRLLLYIIKHWVKNRLHN